MINTYLLSLCTIMAVSAASAQDLALVNLEKSPTRRNTIYIGVENRFRIIGSNRLKQLTPGAPISAVRGDTLILTPNTSGALVVVMHTADEMQEVQFIAKPISGVTVAIGGMTKGAIHKNDLLQHGRLSLHSFDTQETFFNNFRVSAFDAQLNGQTFPVTGNELPEALLTAIRQATAGDKLLLSSVTATEPITGRTLHLSGTSFVLK